MRKTSGPLKPVAVIATGWALGPMQNRHRGVTTQAGAYNVCHTWHLTVLFTNFLGKMLSPIFLRGIPQSGGDPGGVELWELAAITEPCLSLPESGLFLDVNSVRHTAIREPVFNNNIDY